MARQALSAGACLLLATCCLTAGLAQEPRLEIDLEQAARATVRLNHEALELVGDVQGARLAAGAAAFAEPRAHVTFGPHAALGVTSEEGFTIDCELRTRQAGFATILMCREDGAVHWSLVLGREPGQVSIELWSWASERALSGRRVDDGAWHRIRGCYDAPSRRLALLVDGELADVVQISQPFGGSPRPRLRLGENLDPGVHQQFAGELRAVALRSGTPSTLDASLRALEASTLLPRGRAAEALERWLVRQRRPRPPQAESAEAWQARVARLRAGVQDALGLWPPPGGGETLAGRPSPLAGAPDAAATDFTRFRSILPLAVVEGGQLARDGYTLTRVYWPAVPGYHASGWLYRPAPRAAKNDAKHDAKHDAKRAAVLCPHGHWQNGARHPVVQSRCITLARQGYVVLAVDSVHVGDDRVALSPIGAMTWNNLRGLELLRSLPEVDGARIGCTGASGGGQQTYYLTALDSGLAAAVPAVMTCYLDRILRDEVHCWCNFSCHLLRAADVPEMAAAFAPRPQLFLSVTGDWTRDFPEHGFPEIRRVYELFGATEKVESRQWPIGHDYNRDMRNTMYAFFDRWLRGNAEPPAAVEPENLAVEPLAVLDGLERQGVPRDPAAIEREFHQRLAAPPLTAEAVGGSGGGRALEATRRRLQRLFAPEEAAAGRARRLEAPSRDAAVGEAWLVASEPEIDLPVLLLRPGTPRAGLAPAIVIGGGGKSRLLLGARPWLDVLLAQGRSVLLADVRYTGELDQRPSWRDPYGRILGQDEGLLAVRDLRAVLDALPQILPEAPPRAVVVAFDRCSVAALFAAGLEPRIEAVVGPRLGPSYRSARRAPQIARVLLHGDLPDAACLMAPRTLLVGGCPDADDWLAARASYERAPGQLVVDRADLEPSCLARLLAERRPPR